MTPEERATQIANGFFLGNPLAYKNLEEQIAGAIRAAVEAERERCAQVAVEHAGPFGGVGRLVLADQIAERIREGNNE